MEAPSPYRDLEADLAELASQLRATTFRFPTSQPFDRERAELARSIDEYLKRRGGDGEAPLVVTVCGPTGGGKSLVVNSLLRRLISPVGNIRPTTLRPVICSHRDHAARSWSEFVGRVKDRVGTQVETVLDDTSWLRWVTIVDSPPFDMPAGATADDGRFIADDVLAITDLCVFVVSALRYADAATWEHLELLRRRGLPVLFVINRLPPDEREHDVLGDYAARLAAAGMLLEPDPSLLFPISEQVPEAEAQILRPVSVALLRTELEQLGDRSMVIRFVDQARRGAVRDLVTRTLPLVAALGHEETATRRLAAAVSVGYREQAGQLLAQPGGESSAAIAVLDPEQGVAALSRVVTFHAGMAAQATATAWESDPAGAGLLVGPGAALWRHGADTPERARAVLTDWVQTLGLTPGKALRRRHQRRLARYVWETIFAPPDATPALASRMDPSNAAAAVARATNDLEERYLDLLRFDALRFHRACGAVPPGRSRQADLSTTLGRVIDAMRSEPL